MSDFISYRSVPSHLKWWQEGRFGLSLHWGLYSIPGRGEWIRSVEQLTDAEYQSNFDSFNPDEGCALEWARVARKAGAQYVTLTTKHHDGFCLFDSQLTDFKSTNTPARRDLVQEFVDALRAEGLRIGFYYSLVDWHHPDYPAAGDRQHPLRQHPGSPDRDSRSNWAGYVDYFHGQLMELCSNYGPIDLLVFDFSYGDYFGEKWASAELMRKIRSCQPDVVINDRLGREALKEITPPSYAGDFDQTEMDIPRAPVCNKAGQAIPWEAWFTLTNSWSHNPSDQTFKSSATIIRALVNCVSKGGNLTLNIAPDPRGHLDTETWRILSEIGDWLAKNGESIYGCGPAEFAKPEWGRFTQNGKLLYAHVLEPVIGHINLPNLRSRIKNGRVLATGAEAKLCDYWNPGIQTFDEPGDIFFNFSEPAQNTWPLPDAYDTVISLETADNDF